MSGDSSIFFVTRNGRADAGQDDKFQALRARLQQPDAKILLHLHGGLVDEADGLAMANRLSGQGEESWKLSEDWTQVYVVWRTGLFETFKTNWTDLIHDDRLYQILLRKLLGFVAERIGVPSQTGGRSSVASSFALDDLEISRRLMGQSNPHAPFADIDINFKPELPEGQRANVISEKNPVQLARDFEAQLKDDRHFKDAIRDLEAHVNRDVEGRSSSPGENPEEGARCFDHFSEELRNEIEAEAARSAGARSMVAVGVKVLKHARNIALRVFRRFYSKRDHGIHATIVEEVCREIYGDFVGAKVWGMMVKDAADHFAEGAFGEQFLDILANSSAPTKFAVSAHSAGSIWASELLLALARREQQTKLNLFLLAPAVRHDLFAKAMAAAGDRVERLTMFTMSDELERADPLFGPNTGFIYPSSLLYAVSGMFEEQSAEAYVDAPLVGMLRFQNPLWLDAQEAQHAQAFFNALGQGDNEIVTAVVPGVCEAKCHGCFDNDPTTLASVVARL